MKIIRVLAIISLLFMTGCVSVLAQYQRRRVPTERTMNDSIRVGKVYEYKLYGDIDGTRRATINVYKIGNDSVWYWMNGEKHIKSYKSLIKCLVLE